MGSFSLLSAAARRLEGKVALITGGASGIGESTARLFSKNGAKVVIADVQDDLGQSVCKNLNPSSTTFVHCDVTNEKEVENAVNTATTKYGKLDIMFNNAGITGVAKSSILDNDKVEFEQLIGVNMVGVFLGIKHAARVMMGARKGTIINTASVSSTIGVRVACVHEFKARSGGADEEHGSGAGTVRDTCELRVALCGGDAIVQGILEA